MTFHRDGKQIGVLDFNGPEMTFVGDADESAKVFFDFIAGWFKARLDQERADEREACAKLVEPDEEHRRDASWGYLGGTEGIELLDGMAAAIRARSNT